MGIKQLYTDNLRKLPNEYGDVSLMYSFINCRVIKIIISVTESLAEKHGPVIQATRHCLTIQSQCGHTLFLSLKMVRSPFLNKRRKLGTSNSWYLVLSVEPTTIWNTLSLISSQSLNFDSRCDGRRGTTDDFVTVPFHLSLFSAALR